tara:strand:- start:3630 stop:4364 length:735 start_codon:yes stop_codon:yes gene_type:complete
MASNYKILKVRDKSDSYYTETPLFDIPMRLLICGRSQLSGKTTVILNLLANPDFPYHKMFKGENIHIVSNNQLDNKLVMLANRLDIPEQNMTMYDESYLELLYDQMEQDFLKEIELGKPANRLIIFDDCGFSGSLRNKNAGIISRMICNGRHLNLSQIYTCQKYSQCSTTLRTNITGGIFFGTSMRELESISEDFNYFDDKKKFVQMFRDATKKPRSFLVVNFSRGIDPATLYYDTDFNPILLK